MKSKSLLIYSLVAAPVCMLLRVLQYIYIIDTEGNYVTISLAGTLLEYSVGAVLALSALVALLCLLTGKRTEVKQNRLCSKRIGALLLVVAALMLCESGIGIGSMLTSFKLNATAILGVFAALCYALQGICFIKENALNGFTKLMGLFPSAYFCVRGIALFFESFKLSNTSTNRLEMLSICALALWSVTVSGILAGAFMKESRLVMLSMLTAVFVSAPLAAQVADFIVRPLYVELSSVLWLVQKLVFVIIAVIVMLRVSFMKDQPEDVDPEPIEFGNNLDVYIDDIPEPADE